MVIHLRPIHRDHHFHLEYHLGSLGHHLGYRMLILDLSLLLDPKRLLGRAYGIYRLLA
jgi:hypothetical protein